MQKIYDILGLVGFGAMSAGLYLRFGLADALIAAGSAVLLLALAASRARKRGGGRA